jgi:hypothetical protein
MYCPGTLVCMPLMSLRLSGNYLPKRHQQTNFCINTKFVSCEIQFFLHSGGWNQGPLDTAATNGLLYQPRVIMIMEKSVE